MIELAQGVLAVAHATHRTRECHAVFFVDGQGGRHLECILQRGAVYIVRIRELCILAYADDFVNLVGAVETCREILEVGIFQHTGSLLVAEREERGALFVGLRERQVVVLGEARAAYLVHPVGIAERHGPLGIHVTVVETAYVIVDRRARRRIVDRDGHSALNIEGEAVVGCIVLRTLRVVQGCLHQCGGILPGVEQLHLLRHPRHRQRRIEIDVDVVALLTLLGGNHHHAVGSARTVDRGRGSILQHLHRLDIRRVQTVQRATEGDAVYYIKRCSAGTAHRADTTNTYVGLARG